MCRKPSAPALEQDIPLRFIDPLTLRYPLFFDRFPDAYLIDKIGQNTFFENLLPTWKPAKDDAENAARETFMVARLQEAEREYEKILFVGGLAHIPGIVARLKTPQALPMMKTGVEAAVVAPMHPESLKKGFTEIPRITETFENWRVNPDEPPPVNRHELDPVADARVSRVFQSPDPRRGPRLRSSHLGQIPAQMDEVQG